MSGPIEDPNNGRSGHSRPRAYSSTFALCRRLMLATLTGGVAWAQEPAVSVPAEQRANESDSNDVPVTTVLRDQVRVTGIVVHPADQQPLPGASVEAVSASGERVTVTTDIEGSFSLKSLADGEWTITATFPDLEATSTTITVSSSQVIDLQFTMGGDQISGSDSDLVIEARKETIGVTERVIEREEIQYLPGTGGDAVKVVQNLPGVARPPLGVGQLIIRGVDPEDSSFFLDGGRIPLVFHFSGLTTVIPTNSISEVAYLPGAYGVRFGRTLGGLVDLRTQTPVPTESFSELAVDVYQSAFFSEHKVGRQGGISLSARRSYVDAVLNPILNSGDRRVQAPRYYDAQLRYWNVRPDGARWDAYLFLSDDRFLVLGSDDPDAEVDIGLVTQFQKVRLQHLRPLGRGWYSESVVFGGPETQSFQFEGDGEAYEKNWVVGLRQEFRLLNDGQGPDLKLGLDVEAGQVSYLYDVAGFGESEQGSTPVFMPALYAESTWTLGFLELIPGVRTDTMVFEDGVIGPLLDPRMSLRWEVGPSTTIKAGTGRHTQFPRVRELLDEGDGVPDLNAEWSFQSSVGVVQQILPEFRVEVTAFWNELYDLVSGREDAFRFFTGPPPFGPFDTDPYANDGTGRIQGVETMMRLDTDRMVAFAALTLSQSTRVDRPGEDQQLFRYDQPYTLNVLASRELRKNRRLGVRVRSSSGYVYTPVVNRIYDLDSREFSPVFGERDSARLPPFFSLDIRFDKEWELRRVNLAAYIDLQNATNTTNPEVMSWNYDYSEEEPVESSPTLPAFGFRVEW